MNYSIKLVHISTLKSTDTVEHNGKIHTVGNNIKYDSFLGHTLYGDSYRLGSLPVKLVCIHTPVKGKGYFV